jgi:hypothetical protein
MVSVPRSSSFVALRGDRTHWAITSIVPPLMSLLARPCQRPIQLRRHSGGLKLPRVVSVEVCSNGTGLSSIRPASHSGAHDEASVCSAARAGGKS